MEGFCEKPVLENSVEFSGKQLCESIFAGLRPGTLLKKRFWHRFFPMNFMKILKDLFL